MGRTGGLEDLTHLLSLPRLAPLSTLLLPALAPRLSRNSANSCYSLTSQSLKRPRQDTQSCLQGPRVAQSRQVTGKAIGTPVPTAGQHGDAGQDTPQCPQITPRLGE